MRDTENTRGASRRTQLGYLAKGKCSQCGKGKLITDTLCRKCAAKHAAATIALKKRLIEDGLCSQCGHEPLDTARLCRACQDKHNARCRERRGGSN